MNVDANANVRAFPFSPTPRGLSNTPKKWAGAAIRSFPASPVSASAVSSSQLESRLPPA